MLTQGGFHNVTPSPTAKRPGCLAMKNERYDLLVTDVEMPRLDGVALTKQVKEHLN